MAMAAADEETMVAGRNGICAMTAVLSADADTGNVTAARGEVAAGVAGTVAAGLKGRGPEPVGGVAAAGAGVKPGGGAGLPGGARVVAVRLAKVAGIFSV